VRALRHRPRRVELEQLLGHLAQGRPNRFLEPLPRAPAQPIQPGRSFRRAHVLGDQIEPLHRQVEPAAREPWLEISLDAGRREIFLPAGIRIDLGGVAKGWAAHQAMLQLAELGPVLVDSGGDIASSGPQTSGEPWPVAVADPFQLQDRLELLALGSCGVATSGTDYRRWFKDGIWKHHIIDPRTGQSAQTDLVSVTVAGPDVLQAEAAAKAVLILGSRLGLDWLEDRPSLAGLLARQDGRIIYSSEIDAFVWRAYASTDYTLP
jgi:thiamine biosynthesis lipoprotein